MNWRIITRLYVQKTEWFKKKQKLKAVDPKTNENKILKPKVLDNIGGLFNELYYICKDKHNEEKDDLNTKDKKPLYFKKLRLTNDYQYEFEEEKMEEKEQQISKMPDKKEPLKKSTKDDWIKFNEWVNEKEKDINSELFQEYFRYQKPSDMLRDLYKINDKYKSKDLVNVIKSGLIDFKNETKNMTEEEKEIEKPNEIVNINEEIEFNKQKQEGKWLKILTPDQMLSRLAITLAQLKLLFYFLYRSKKLTKTIYNHLINNI